MKMSNSPLVVYTKLSQNHSGLRTHVIDTITPHCVVGQLSLQTLGNIFAPGALVSSNYGIDAQGRVGMYVEEKNRSWCSSSNVNDQRAVTIEIASETVHPYKITNAAMDGLIKLSADICKRNGIPKLLWKADKNLIGKVDQQNISVHRWFANKSCPGDYIYGRLGEVASEVNKILLPVSVATFPYTVKIVAQGLNYRRGPGTNYAVNGMVHRNEVYTIIDEANGIGASKWGKLKSGAGWISLDSEYCTKMR